MPFVNAAVPAPVTVLNLATTGIGVWTVVTAAPARIKQISLGLSTSVDAGSRLPVLQLLTGGLTFAETPLGGVVQAASTDGQFDAFPGAVVASVTVGGVTYQTAPISDMGLAPKTTIQVTVEGFFTGSELWSASLALAGA